MGQKSLHEEETTRNGEPDKVERGPVLPVSDTDMLNKRHDLT